MIWLLFPLATSCFYTGDTLLISAGAESGARPYGPSSPVCPLLGSRENTLTRLRLRLRRAKPGPEGPSSPVCPVGVKGEHPHLALKGHPLPSRERGLRAPPIVLALVLVLVLELTPVPVLVLFLVLVLVLVLGFFLLRVIRGLMFDCICGQFPVSFSGQTIVLPSPSVSPEPLSRGMAGRVMVNVAPWDGLDWTSILPWCSWMSFFATARPRPVPFWPFEE